MLAIHNILFPTDFSQCARGAFDMAAALARDHRACLTVLHVREYPVVPLGEFGAIPLDDMPTREGLLMRLTAYEPADESINLEYVLAEGPPDEQIVATATERGCDLIVMGTHGRTGLGRLLMGSVAEQVMRHAPCPVLTLKQPMAIAASQPVNELAAV